MTPHWEGISSGISILNINYDPQTDRLASKQTSFGTISYTYDAAGDVTQIASSNASGSVVAYQYDKLNRLSTVTVPGQSPTNYSYDAVGNLAGYTYPNGVTTALQYDPLNRLTTVLFSLDSKNVSYVFDPTSNRILARRPANVLMGV